MYDHYASYATEQTSMIMLISPKLLQARFTPPLHPFVLHARCHCHLHAAAPTPANAHYFDTQGNCARPRGRRHRNRCRSDFGTFRTRIGSTRSRLRLVLGRPRCRLRWHRGLVEMATDSRNTVSSPAPEPVSRGLRSNCGAGRGDDMSAPGEWTGSVSGRTSGRWRADCRLWLCSESTGSHHASVGRGRHRSWLSLRLCGRGSPSLAALLGCAFAFPHRLRASRAES